MKEIFATKYEILKDNALTLKDGRQVFRIKALRDIDNHEIVVKKGDLGGYVASEGNLSQMGDSWIGPGSIVCGGAFVSSENVAVIGDSYICNSYKHEFNQIGRNVSIINSYIEDCDFDIATEGETEILNSKLIRCAFENATLVDISSSILTDCHMSSATIGNSTIENAKIPHNAYINTNNYAVVDRVPVSMVVGDTIFLCRSNPETDAAPFIITSTAYKHDGNIDDLIYKIRHSYDKKEPVSDWYYEKGSNYHIMIESLINMIICNSDEDYDDFDFDLRKFTTHEYYSIINNTLIDKGVK
jgi:hypothetical protein